MAINPFRKGGNDTIPVNEGGTGATDAASALSNLGGLDTSAHAVIDHTGLPGIGAGLVVKTASFTTGNVIQDTGAAVGADDTIPTNTEGFQVMSLAYTPLSASNILEISVAVHAQSAGFGTMTAALFDGGSSALAVGAQDFGGVTQCSFIHRLTAGSTSLRTYTVRLGHSAGSSVTFNGFNGVRRYGGALSSYIIIREYTP